MERIMMKMSVIITEKHLDCNTCYLLTPVIRILTL